MLHQLLWIEIVLKASSGLLLAAAPRTLARLLGLPGAEHPLWPRLLGAMLIGLAVASWIEARLQPGKALGLLGSAAINLSAAVMIGSLLILGWAGASRRGRLMLWLAAAALTLLALVEIVSVG